MCTAATLTHHTHAAETTLPLITAAATQRRSRSARTRRPRLTWRKAELRLEISGKKVTSFYFSNLPNLLLPIFSTLVWFFRIAKAQLDATFPQKRHLR